MSALEKRLLYLLLVAAIAFAIYWTWFKESYSNCLSAASSAEDKDCKSTAHTMPPNVAGIIFDSLAGPLQVNQSRPHVVVYDKEPFLEYVNITPKMC